MKQRRVYHLYKVGACRETGNIYWEVIIVDAFVIHGLALQYMAQGIKYVDGVNAIGHVVECQFDGAAVRRVRKDG